MSPELILATIRAVSEAIAEGFRWAQTPEGIAFTKKVREDSVAREKFFSDLSAGATKFFQGGLFK